MSTIRTLIVDDEARIRRGIERAVRSCGEEWEIVGSLSNGRAAYEAIANQNMEVDLLITDVQMPEMDGLSLIKELKKIHSFFSIIISGYDDFKYLQTAIYEGAKNYLLKPIDKEQFRLQMQEIKEKVTQARQQQSELIELQEKATQGIKTKQVHLLSEVTWDVETDVSMFDWTNQFPKGTYLLMHIAGDQMLTKPIEEVEKEHFTIEGIFEKLLSHYDTMDCWYWRRGKLNYWMLFHNKVEFDSALSMNVTQYAQQLKDAVQKSTSFTISIAIGLDFADLSLLPNFRDQLMALIQFRLIRGGNNIFLLDVKSFSNEKPKGVSPSIQHNIEEIVHAIDRRSESDVKKLLNQFFLQLEPLPSPIFIKETVYYLFIHIIKLWMDQNASGEEFLLEVVNMTKNASSFSQLKDCVKQWVLVILKKMQDSTIKRPESVLVAKEWIHNNLNENITIKRLASLVYMYPTYFCEYFKSQTGETVLDYVTKCRMEKAKELLKSNEWRIYEIAQKVGYQDTKYFSRLFKQWTGFSPSEYKENHIKFA